MAKFNMKDYENFMKEEARQDRLQNELEDRNREEAYDAVEDWHDWQREQEEERRRKEFNSYPEYDGYFDEDDFDDDCDYDDGQYDDLDDSFSEDTVLKCRIVKKSNKTNQQEDRICRKAVARNRHLNKAKERYARVQYVTYVAKREMRKCYKLIRKLDREYLNLSTKLFSDTYLPYSKSQGIIKQLNIILDQLNHLQDEAVYFEGILEMSEYKQALSTPRAV